MRGSPSQTADAWSWEPHPTPSWPTTAHIPRAVICSQCGPVAADQAALRRGWNKVGATASSEASIRIRVRIRILSTASCPCTALPRPVEPCPTFVLVSRAQDRAFLTRKHLSRVLPCTNVLVVGPSHPSAPRRNRVPFSNRLSTRSRHASAARAHGAAGRHCLQWPAAPKPPL